jgi:hypothetical protein
MSGLSYVETAVIVALEINPARCVQIIIFID